MTRSPFLGLPVVCAASVFLVGMATAARYVLADLSLGTGVPDMGLIGLMFFGVFVLPGVALSIACVGLALGGVRQLGAGRPGTLSAAAWLTAVGGGGLAVFASGTEGLHLVGLAAVGLSLAGLVGLRAGGRRVRRGGTTGA